MTYGQHKDRTVLLQTGRTPYEIHRQNAGQHVAINSQRALHAVDIAGPTGLPILSFTEHQETEDTPHDCTQCTNPNCKRKKS